MRFNALVLGISSCALLVGSAAGQAIGVAAVPGKEYISEPNTNAVGFITPGQVLQFDGVGNVANGNFLGVAGAALHLDALANQGDAFFNQLRTDVADLVVSFRVTNPTGAGGRDVSSMPPPGPLAALWYSEATPAGASRGVWANTTQVDNVNRPDNVYGVELWGTSNDTNFWSYQGDTFGGNTSIWTNVSGAPAPYLSRFVIAAAIAGTPGLDIDVDGLMVNDQGNLGRWDNGDSIIFSVAPNPLFDGGEIWTLDNVGGVAVANFLVHGGITWDTAHNVQATFGYLESTEDIDAIEAILPTPGSLGLLGIAGLVATRRRRR